MFMIIYMTETGHKTDTHWAVCIIEKALMTKYSKEAAQCSGTQHTHTLLSHCGQTLLSTKSLKSKINTCPAPNTLLAIHAFLSTDAHKSYCWPSSQGVHAHSTSSLYFYPEIHSHWLSWPQGKEVHHTKGCTASVRCVL